jgi:hypothetical protein
LEPNRQQGQQGGWSNNNSQQVTGASLTKGEVEEGANLTDLGGNHLLKVCVLVPWLMLNAIDV